MRRELALIPASLAALAANAQGLRPNIVYIMTDDHTAQMMSCYDTRYVETPNLDRIARDGVRFTHSYVANSLSGPSRACMLTGKHSHKNGFTNNEHGIFDGSQQTMPKLLQAAGYETCLIGKWHLVSTPTGFDHWEILPAQGDYYNPTFIHMDGTRSADSGYVTRIITDKAIEWMENRRPTPFALFIHHKASPVHNVTVELQEVLLAVNGVDVRNFATLCCLQLLFKVGQLFLQLLNLLWVSEYSRLVDIQLSGHPKFTEFSGTPQHHFPGVGLGCIIHGCNNGRVV